MKQRAVVAAFSNGVRSLYLGGSAVRRPNMADLEMEEESSDQPGDGM